MNVLANLVVQHPRKIILFFITITILFAIPLKDAAVDPDVQNMLPPDMPEHKMLKEIEETFGGMEMALVVIQSKNVLKKKVRENVGKITEALRSVPGVERVHTIPDAEVDPFDDDDSPAAEKRKEQELRAKIIGNDLVYGTLISKDFTALAVIVQLRNDGKEYEITKKIRKTVEQFDFDQKVIFGGLPFIKERISEDVPADMMRFMPLGLLIMLIFLYICFRQLIGVVLPFSVVLMSIVFAMGLVPLLGWKMMTITIILPVILIAIANNYGIHLISHYQQDNIYGEECSNKDLAKGVFTALFKPVVATGLTTIAGMLCLLTHIIVPAAQLGILAAAGILFALLASLFFIPASLAVLPKMEPAIKKDVSKRSQLEKQLYNLAWFVSNNPKRILLVSLLFTAITAAGISLINVESNLVAYYPENHPIAESSRLVNEKLGGAQVVAIVAEGDMRDPEMLQKIDHLEQKLLTMPEIDSTTSVAKLLKLMTKGFHKKDEPQFGKLPEKTSIISWYFEQYAKMGDPEGLKRLVNSDFTQAQITVQINSESSEVLKRVVEKIHAAIGDDKIFTKVSGSGVIFASLIDQVVRGQLFSLLLSLVVVAFLVMILFKSFVAGLIATVPLALSLTLLFGFMGYFGISLDIATAMLSSILIGVGVDYTIHFLYRYREERRIGRSPVKSVRQTLRTTGRGIIFNAFSVNIGFVVLLFSIFLPIRFFGFLIILSITTCLIGALIILPPLCIIIRPKFLEPENSDAE